MPLFNNLFFFIAFLLFFLTPGSDKMFFSGMPLSSTVEFFAFFFILALFWGKLITEEIEIIFDHKIGYFILLCILFASWKLYLFRYEPPAGFVAKYRTLFAAAPNLLTPPGSHEFSTDNFFNSRNFTRMDKFLKFDSDWKLGFWNQFRFNIFQWIDGNQIRERNPFEVTWTGTLRIPVIKHASLQCEYTGKVTMKIGTATWDFPENYRSKECARIPLAELIPLEDSFCRPLLLQPPPPSTFTAPLEISYRYDIPSMTGSSTIGPNANFCLTLNDGLYPPQVIGSTEDWTGSILRNFAFLMDLSIAVLIIMLLLNELAFLLNDESFYLILAGWGFCYAYYPDGFYIVAPLSIFMKVLYETIRKDKSDEFSTNRLKLVNLLIFLFLIFPHFQIDLSNPVYRPPGGDALTYESISREMLRDTDRFFQGLDPVFVFQPFFRYYLAVMHIVFGESGEGIILFTKFLFYCLIPLMARSFSSRMGFTLSLFFALTFIGFEHSLIFQNIDKGWSDNLGWYFFLLPVLSAFAFDNAISFLLTSFLLGVSVINRLNLSPGCLFLLLCCYALFTHRNEAIRKNSLLKMSYFAIFIGVYSLIPLHNLYYGDRLVFSVIEINMPKVQDLPPQKIFDIFSDPSIKEYLRERFYLFFYFFRVRLLNTVAALWLLAFLTQIIIMLRRRTAIEIINWCFLFSPLPFMIVHVFFSLDSGYPRFLVSYLIAMFIFPIYAFGGYLDCFLKMILEKTGIREKLIPSLSRSPSEG